MMLVALHSERVDLCLKELGVQPRRYYRIQPGERASNPAEGLRRTNLKEKAFYNNFRESVSQRLCDNG
jgi:hypothetical protein